VIIIEDRRAVDERFSTVTWGAIVGGDDCFVCSRNGRFDDGFGFSVIKHRRAHKIVTAEYYLDRDEKKTLFI